MHNQRRAVHIRIRAKPAGTSHINSIQYVIDCVEIDPFVQTGQSFMRGEAKNLTKKGVDTQQDRERRAGGNFLREENLKQAREER